MKIRQAEMRDLPVLLDFQKKLAFESEGVSLDEDLLSKGLTSLLQDASKGVYNIVEEDGLAIGCYLVTYEWSDWRNGMVWWMQSVYVHTDQRKKGVFRKMYEHIIAAIQSSDELIGLRLYVDKTNEKAMKVYSSMGMNGDHYTVYEWMK